MANQKAAITQAEVARLAKGMRAAGIDEFSIKVEKPDAPRFPSTRAKLLRPSTRATISTR